MTKESIIKTITPNTANFDHIKETGRINGSLFIDISNAMETYADLKLSEYKKRLIEEIDKEIEKIDPAMTRLFRHGHLSMSKIIKSIIANLK